MRAIILAAGMGTRLGLGIPKCLVEVGGRSILSRQLESLDRFDVTVVVGFQADRVIEEIGGRAQVVVNGAYGTTSPCHSIALCSGYADRCLILDGDLIFPLGELDGLIGALPFVGVSLPRSTEPVYAEVQRGEVTEFSNNPRKWEWACIFCERPSLFRGVRLGYVYTVLAQSLPMQARRIECFEVDTEEDLRGAREWARLKTDQRSFGFVEHSGLTFCGPT